jgi:hypothetical protein
VKQTERGKWARLGLRAPIRFPYLHLAAAYAFCPDEKLRDPAQALAMAERAGAVSGERFVECVEVLAALHAHAGDFEAAIRVQTRAVKQLSPAGVLRDVPSLRKEMEKAAQGRLEQYRQGKAVWDFERDLTGPAVPLP